MRAFVLLFLTAILFSGCVSKKILVKEDLIYEQALKNSKSAQFIKDKKVHAYIVATYLNQIKSKYTKNDEYERFVVGVYAPQKSGLESEIVITLNNDVNNTVVEKLDYENEILNVIPSKNVWNKYYLAEIKKRESKEIDISFENENFKKVNLRFIKNEL